MASFYPLLHGHTLQRTALVLCWLIVALILPLAASVGAENPRQDIPLSYELVAENDLFQLYVDAETLAFKLRDKRSDYLWHSGIDEPLEDDRLNNVWQAFARSGISIEYLNARASNKRVSISNSEVTLSTMPIEQGVSWDVTFEEYGITVGVALQLEATGVRVEVPFESIREENADFRLGRIYVYPFLGATRGGSVPGYMLIPDGTGSLIQFADSTRAQNLISRRYYGPDLGMIGIQPWDSMVVPVMPISFPVFGMVHGAGQNAFLSIVEDGAAYGELQTHPAGVITNFNFIHSSFIYSESYFQPTNRAGAGVTIVQREPNAFDAVIHYRFLTGDNANYVGMARSYQEYLVNHGLLHKYDDPNPNIGIRLEFLGGDKEKVLAWYRFVSMTTINQMRDILAGLQLPNPEVIYYGWQPSGANTMPPTSLAVESDLGSVDDLRALAADITTNGGHFALYYDPQSALWGESGYSSRKDLAMAITNVYVEGYTRFPANYFTLSTLEQRYTDFTADVAARLDAGLALDSIGSILYGDFRGNHPFFREDAITAYQALLAESPVRLGLYRPNAYLFGLTQAYYDMPLGDNGYIYTSGAVPFLPIVLAGYVPYYGTVLNFSSNPQDDLLRHVEYGIYPSYFLTHEATSNMLYTASNWIYTSSYAQWGDEIRQTYQWLNDLLAPVRGQEIIAHEQLAEGIFATTYANQRQIIVNYTEQPFDYGGVTVEARDARLLEVRP